MDNLVRGLGALAGGVDRANGSGLIDNLGGNGRGSARSSGGDGLGLRSAGLLGRNAESERDDLGDVSLGTEDADGDTQGLSEKPHSLETFLKVGIASSVDEFAH